MTVDFLLLVGLLGSVLALIPFYLNQKGKLSTKSFTYDGLNALSALLLGVYAFLEHAWPFVLTNTVWFLVSFSDVAKVIRRSVASKRKRR
jgi:hypothetical membrane protein